MNSFARLIKELRQDIKISQAELAYLIGISEFEIMQIEKGAAKTPGPYLLLKLADALHFPFAELMKQAGCIDTYENASKVRSVFEELDMIPDSWVHIKSVDHMTSEEIQSLKNFYQEMYKRAKKSKNMN